MPCTWWGDDYLLLTYLLSAYLLLTTHLVGPVVWRQAVLREDDDVTMVSQLLP